MHAAAAFDDLGEEGSGSPVDDGDVVVGGEDDIDLHAPSRRNAEGAEDRGVGNEIGRSDADVPGGGREPAEDDLGHVLEVLVGAVGDAARSDVILGAFDLREPKIAAEGLASGKVPVDGEDLHQVGDDGTHELEVGALDRKSRLQFEAMALADIRPAGETGFAVDDEDLAVVAEVGVIEQAQASCGEEGAHIEAFGAETVHHARLAVSRAHEVNEDAHFDASVPGGLQALQELLTRLVAVENVAEEGDGHFSPVDGIEHGRISLVAVAQEGDGIARENGFSRDVFPQLGEAPESGTVFEHLGSELEINVVVNGRFGGMAFADLEGDSLALDAIDPERVIGEGAHEGREPREPHPRDDGTGFPLLEDRMKRHGERQGEIDRGDNVSPRIGEEFKHGGGRSLNSLVSSFTKIHCLF